MTWNKFIIKPRQVLELFVGPPFTPGRRGIYEYKLWKTRETQCPKWVEAAPCAPHDITYLFH